MAAVKTSLLMLYRRLFGVNPHFRRAIYAGLAVIAVWFVGLLVVAILSSIELEILTPKNSVIASSTCNLAADLMILCFPVGMVLRLQVSTRTKVKLLALFLLGIL